MERKSVILCVLFCLFVSPFVVQSASLDDADIFFTSQLNSFQMVSTTPLGDHTNATGLGVFVLNKLLPAWGHRFLTFTIIHDVENATGITLHSGDPGVDGSIEMVLTSGKTASASPVNGRIQIPFAKNSAIRDSVITMLGGFSYLNITSEAFPEGEIRGQMLNSSQSLVQFSGLNLAQPVETLMRGLGLLTYDPVTNVLNYKIQALNSVSPFSLTLNGPSAGRSAGTLITSASFSANTIAGNFTLTCAQEEYFYANQLAMQLTGSLPSKRDTTTTQTASTSPITHVANLTGSQVAPTPVNTAAQGLGQYTWTASTYTLASKVQYSGMVPAMAHNKGSAAVGQPQGSPFVQRNLPPPTNFTFTDTWAAGLAVSTAINNQLLFTDIHSTGTNYPPHIRGQIVPSSVSNDGGGANLKRSCNANIDVCSMHSSCEDCSNTTGCGWCDTYKSCQSGSSSGPSQGSCPAGWNYGSTSSCPCRTKTSCTTCTAASGCGWCPSSLECASTASYHYQDCSFDWVKGYNYQTCDACNQHLTCGDCATNGCGWCSSTNKCVSGTSSGPKWGTCSVWSWGLTNCLCTNSPLSDDCLTCTANPLCGWCGDSSRCVAGASSTGPDYGTCSAWKKTLLQC